jgi:hypothetical protein
MLHQSFLFLTCYFAQINFSQFVDQIQLINCILQTSHLFLKLFDHTLNNASFILQLLIACDQLVQVLFLLILLLGQISDFFR